MVNTKEKILDGRRETTKELAEINEEVLAKYKADLPTYLDQKLQGLIITLEDHTSPKGLTTAEILSLIRAKNMYGTVPKYSVEELSILFEYYQKYIVEINKRVKFPPSKKNFCAFCGISTNMYDSYLTSEDEARSEQMRMIDDYITDVNLVSAQTKEIDNISTMFRTKAEHGMVEASAPVVIEHKSEFNLNKIQQQIAQLKENKTLKTIEHSKTNYEIE